jgi:thiol-disulfide isomerase/thioredoxin
VLNFVSADSNFCKRQIPVLESVRAEYGPRGVLFANVGQTQRKEFSAGEMAAVMKELGSNLALAYDPKNEIGAKFKITNYPTLIMIRRDGVIDAVIFGARENLAQALRAKLDAILKADKSGK